MILYNGLHCGMYIHHQKDFFLNYFVSALILKTLIALLILFVCINFSRLLSGMDIYLDQRLSAGHVQSLWKCTMKYSTLFQECLQPLTRWPSPPMRLTDPPSIRLYNYIICVYNSDLSDQNITKFRNSKIKFKIRNSKIRKIQK